MSMKILVIRFSSIGDIVLTTPILRAIKTQIGAELHFCTKKNFSSIVSHNPYLDKIHYLEKDLNTLIKQLKQEKFDIIIDLHNNLRTRIIKLRLGIKSYSFDKLNLEKWLLVNLKINKMPDVHIVDRYFQTVRKIGVSPDSGGLEYYIPEKDNISIDTLSPDFSSGYAAFCIGGQHNTKKLPVARMIELCRQINGPIILLGGKEDESNAEAIAKELKNSSIPIYNACGKYNLNQSASLVKQSTRVFTHDTGLMHIAAAFGKKIYSIWGNTTPLFGMYPYKTPHVIWERKGLKCRPCSKIGYEDCPKGHFKCMNEIVFDLNQ